VADPYKSIRQHYGLPEQEKSASQELQDDRLGAARKALGTQTDDDRFQGLQDWESDQGKRIAARAVDWVAPLPVLEHTIMKEGLKRQPPGMKEAAYERTLPQNKVAVARQEAAQSALKQAELQDLVDTQEWWKGTDPKLKTEEGKPERLYHGTAALPIEEVDRARFSELTSKELPYLHARAIKGWDTLAGRVFHGGLTSVQDADAHINRFFPDWVPVSMREAEPGAGGFPATLLVGVPDDADSVTHLVSRGLFHEYSGEVVEMLKNEVDQVEFHVSGDDFESHLVEVRGFPNVPSPTMQKEITLEPRQPGLAAEPQISTTLRPEFASHWIGYDENTVHDAMRTYDPPWDWDSPEYVKSVDAINKAQQRYRLDPSNTRAVRYFLEQELPEQVTATWVSVPGKDLVSGEPAVKIRFGPDSGNLGDRVLIPKEEALKLILYQEDPKPNSRILLPVEVAEAIPRQAAVESFDPDPLLKRTQYARILPLVGGAKNLFDPWDSAHRTSLWESLTPQEEGDLFSKIEPDVYEAVMDSYPDLKQWGGALPHDELLKATYSFEDISDSVEYLKKALPEKVPVLAYTSSDGQVYASLVEIMPDEVNKTAWMDRGKLIQHLEAGIASGTHLMPSQIFKSFPVSSPELIEPVKLPHNRELFDSFVSAHGNWQTLEPLNQKIRALGYDGLLTAEGGMSGLTPGTKPHAHFFEGDQLKPWFDPSVQKLGTPAAELAPQDLKIEEMNLADARNRASEYALLGEKAKLTPDSLGSKALMAAGSPAAAAVAIIPLLAAENLKAINEVSNQFRHQALRMGKPLQPGDLSEEGLLALAASKPMAQQLHKDGAISQEVLAQVMKHSGEVIQTAPPQSPFTRAHRYLTGERDEF